MLISYNRIKTIVMFTIYNTIQGELPKDPHLKLIDAWFLHCLIMPMVVFILLVTNEVIVHDTTELAECKVTTIKVKGTRRRSGSLVSDPGINKKEKDSLFIRVCQIVVPAISSIFTLAFFTVGFSAHHWKQIIYRLTGGLVLKRHVLWEISLLNRLTRCRELIDFACSFFLSFNSNQT